MLFLSMLLLGALIGFVGAGGAGVTIEAARDDAYNRAAAAGTPFGDDPTSIVVSACP